MDVSGTNPFDQIILDLESTGARPQDIVTLMARSLGRFIKRTNRSRPAQVVEIKRATEEMDYISPVLKHPSTI